MKNNSVYILEDRGILYVNGDDVQEFLQNIISNDINKVTCVYGNLTPKLKWCGVELEEITY